MPAIVWMLTIAGTPTTEDHKLQQEVHAEANSNKNLKQIKGRPAGVHIRKENFNSRDASNS